MGIVASNKKVLEIKETYRPWQGPRGGNDTEAGSGSNVVGLVYVAAHMPDAGERRVLYLDPARFHEYFAADLTDSDAAFNAQAQVLIHGYNFGAAIGTPAWRSKPS